MFLKSWTISEVRSNQNSFLQKIWNSIQTMQALPKIVISDYFYTFYWNIYKSAVSSLVQKENNPIVKNYIFYTN